MNYEEKYKDALEKARKIHHETEFDYEKGMMEEVFPELKENEDERIKREILELVSIAGNGNQFEEIKDWLEKQGEQPTDKLEPKFKVGDWIILPLGIIARIDSINSTDYQVTTTDGKICDFKISKQDNYRLWTIADAKDGDVLVDVYGNIGIFEKCYDFDWMSCCSLGNNGGFQHFTVEHENEKTYPATKEQCNLLFQKMKEAGWERIVKIKN